MSFAFEVDPNLDSVGGMQDQTYVSDYVDFFDEEELEALGINPIRPTAAKPGSEDKVSILAARYAAGLPLWHNEDCYDHSPGGGEPDDEFDD